MSGAPRHVPPGVTMLVGGARSGKSTLAVQIGLAFPGPVTFLATATAGDADMGRRIARHRSERPDWPTVEEPLEVARATHRVDDDHLLVIDCLTLWVANLLGHGAGDDQILDAAGGLADAVSRRRGPTVVVSNEVGLGIHPARELARHYRDLLGHTNRIVGHVAERVLFLSAGRAMALEDPWVVMQR